MMRETRRRTQKMRIQYSKKMKKRVLRVRVQTTQRLA